MGSGAPGHVPVQVGGEHASAHHGTPRSSSQVRLGTYKSEESAPPGAQVARHRQQIDPNDKAQTGERIPFIVVSRQESGRLRDSAQRPEVLLFPPHGVLDTARWQAPRPDVSYYILNRILPALGRIFGLIGVDVFIWYKQEMRRSRRAPLDRAVPAADAQRARHGATIVGYFESSHCILCDKPCPALLCAECSDDRLTSTVALTTRRNLLEARVHALVAHCLRCSAARVGPIECRNLDCPHLYSRLKLQRQYTTAVDHLGSLARRAGADQGDDDDELAW